MPSPTDTKQWANTVLNALTCQPSQVYSVEYAASVRAVIQVTAQVLLLAWLILPYLTVRELNCKQQSFFTVKFS